MNARDLQKLTDWLIDGARSAPSSPQMMAETCERLVAAGLPLWRVGVFVRTLHPDIIGVNFIWRPGAEVAVGRADYDMLDSPEYRNSPLAIVFGEGREVRALLDSPDSKRFPFLDDMREEGVTDYIALPILQIDGSVHASSWTTKQPGGFTDEQLNNLRSLIPPLSRVIEITRMHRTASNLLDIYVGNRAGERIMGGQIRRGHTDTMLAAIWLSDLRGFTALSDRLPAETVVDILNQYFDCQVSAIKAHGGEVLKFMGDGLLAVFPIAEVVGDIEQVCGVFWKLPASRVAMSKPCITRLVQQPSDSVSASRCMSAKFSTAISAAATGSTSPALGRRSISPRGWKKSRAGCIARWWRRRNSLAPAPATGAISANFRSRDSRWPSASTVWRMRRRAWTQPTRPLIPRVRW